MELFDPFWWWPLSWNSQIGTRPWQPCACVVCFGYSVFFSNHPNILPVACTCNFMFCRETAPHCLQQIIPRIKDLRYVRSLGTGSRWCGHEEAFCRKHPTGWTLNIGNILEVWAHAFSGWSGGCNTRDMAIGYRLVVSTVYLRFHSKKGSSIYVYHSSSEKWLKLSLKWREAVNHPGARPKPGSKAPAAIFWPGMSETKSKFSCWNHFFWSQVDTSSKIKCYQNHNECPWGKTWFLPCSQNNTGQLIPLWRLQLLDFRPGTKVPRGFRLPGSTSVAMARCSIFSPIIWMWQFRNHAEEIDWVEMSQQDLRNNGSTN